MNSSYIYTWFSASLITQCVYFRCQVNQGYYYVDILYYDYQVGYASNVVILSLILLVKKNKLIDVNCFSS